MSQRFLAMLRADARFYHRLKRGGRDGSSLGVLLTSLASPGLWMLTFQRVAYYSTVNRNLRTPSWWVFRFVESIGAYLNAVIGKSDLADDCEVLGPIYLPDKGYCMLGAVSVGAGSMFHHRVTLGIGVTTQARPTVGTDVWVGPDCIIAGKLHIGDGATILPGSYLTASVPPRAVVQGNPARVICENFDNSELRRSLTIVTDLKQLQR